MSAVTEIALVDPVAALHPYDPGMRAGLVVVDSVYPIHRPSERVEDNASGG